jgi:hypothetical protein
VSVSYNAGFLKTAIRVGISGHPAVLVLIFMLILKKGG